MFYASASSNVWRYFSGRSYVCCHHLDPGVFSSLPPKVAIQQWKYYMQTFLKWCQEIFMFFRNFVLYQRIFCFFQWTFYLLLSCATFSSVDNVTECVDCVSGWTFFCPQNVSSVYKCLMCPYWTVPRCFQLCAKTGPLSKTQTTLKVQTMTDWPRNLYLISTFSNPSDSCQYEMLRPPVCSCSVPGECETSEDNVLEVWNLFQCHTFFWWSHTISLEAVRGCLAGYTWKNTVWKNTARNKLTNLSRCDSYTIEWLNK